MRSLFRAFGLLGGILAVSVFLAVPARAADFDSFTDVHGHWAEAHLRRAVDEELLTGVSRQLLCPDAPATLSQALTILCRILEPQAAVDPAELGLTGGEWYAPYACGGAAMGLDFDPARLQGGLFTRSDAFLLIAQAFRLIPAQPDYSVLDAFPDAVLLTGDRRDAAAALVSQGYVNGSGGYLNPLSPVSRAELLAMMLRVDEAAVSSDTAPDSVQVRTVISHTGDLAGRTYDKPVWVAGQAAEVDLSGLRAGTVVVLSGNARILVDARTSIDRLVLAGGPADALELSPGHVGTLVLTDGVPRKVTVRGGVDKIELTADNIDLTVNTVLSDLTVSGSGSTVTLVEGGTGSVVLTGASVNNTVTFLKPVSALLLDGQDNSVEAAADCSDAVIGGRSCTVRGLGRISSVELRSRSSRTLTAVMSSRSLFPTGLDAVEMNLTVPETAPAGAPVRVSLNLSAQTMANYTLTWYVDEAAVRTETVPVMSWGNNLSLDAVFPLSVGMSELHTVRAELADPAGHVKNVVGFVELTGLDTLLDGAGITLTSRACEEPRLLRVDAAVTSPRVLACVATWFVDGAPVSSAPVEIGPEPVTLELTHSIDHIPRDWVAKVELRLAAASSAASGSVAVEMTPFLTEADVLAAVTSTYAGDYTLEWALANDYDELVKTLWVNAKGYASDTEYLIWVNRTYQRVNIFEGSQGSWTLVHTFLCGTGKSATATPVSVSKVRHRIARGWTHPTYNVRPVVYFLTGGYAFHSRLWDPSHTHLTDDRIGFPISMGCVRMYDEDVQWIFDNIPTGTTVVVH